PVAAGSPAWPSQGATASGLSPGRTTIRTSTTAVVGGPGRIFQAASWGPTQSTYGREDAPRRSDGRPRTTNPSCGTYRRSARPRDASSSCHADLIGASKWTTPTLIPRESSDHHVEGDGSAATSTAPAANWR